MVCLGIGLLTNRNRQVGYSSQNIEIGLDLRNRNYLDHPVWYT